MSRLTGVRMTMLTMAAVCCLSPALARAAAQAGETPTLAARTAVHGNDLPQALVNGTWKAQGKGWHLVARSLAPPLGHTDLFTTWRGPTVQVVKGSTLFTSDLLLTHQSTTAFSFNSEQHLRVCGGAQCSKWFVLKTGLVPLTYSVHGKPFEIRVSSGRAVSVATTWTGPAATVHVEWQYFQVQKGPDSATADVAIARG